MDDLGLSSAPGAGEKARRPDAFRRIACIPSVAETARANRSKSTRDTLWRGLSVPRIRIPANTAKEKVIEVPVSVFANRPRMRLPHRDSDPRRRAAIGQKRSSGSTLSRAKRAVRTLLCAAQSGATYMCLLPRPDRATNGNAIKVTLGYKQCVQEEEAQRMPAPGWIAVSKRAFATLWLVSACATAQGTYQVIDLGTLSRWQQ